MDSQRLHKGNLNALRMEFKGVTEARTAKIQFLFLALISFTIGDNGLNKLMKFGDYENHLRCICSQQKHS